jgi:hypothetical protein
MFAVRRRSTQLSASLNAGITQSLDENLAYALHRGLTASNLRLGHRPDGAGAVHLDGRPSPISHHVRSGKISGGCHHESGRRSSTARLPPRALGRYAAERDRPCPRPRSGALLLSSVDDDSHQLAL